MQIFDPRAESLAKILVRYSTKIKEGQHIHVQAIGLSAVPFAREVVKEVWHVGAHPYLDISDDDLSEHFFTVANQAHLAEYPAIAEFIASWADASIILVADDNSRRLAHTDPHKLMARQALMQKIRELRLSKPWVLTYLPTHGLAQDAGMSTQKFTDFYYNAVLRDWETEGREYVKIAQWFAGKKTVEVYGEKTELSLSIENRTFVPDCGECNMPGGEVFTAPVETSVEGKVYFNFPLLRSGKYIRDIALWFEKGKIVKAKASENEKYLHTILDTDEGARYLGEFAIGLNPGITSYMSNVLFDEKIKGTIHMAVGMAYKDCGGTNTSAVHMDIIKDMTKKGSKIVVDGQEVFKEGKVLIA